MNKSSIVTFSLMTLLLPFVAACVTSVPGYEGPRVQVLVDNNSATIVANHRSSGWTLQVDRTQVENNTAKVWVTVASSGKGTSSTQEIFLDQERFDNKAFACCQVFAKVTKSGTAHQNTYVPAGLGCN